MREVEVLHDGRKVSPKVSVFIDVSDNFVTQEVFFRIEIEEHELLLKAVMQGDQFRERIFVALFIIKRLLGLVAAGVIIHVIVKCELLLLRLLCRGFRSLLHFFGGSFGLRDRLLLRLFGLFFEAFFEERVSSPAQP